MKKRLYWFILNLARCSTVFRIPIEIAAYLYYRLFRSNKTFSFQGKKYHYFYHPYNRTIASERVVEIPLGKAVFNFYLSEKKHILEVGNVLSHYFPKYPTYHAILDKYEKKPGVINQDVENCKLSAKYDLVISISTMEHVGWTYGEKRDLGKFLRSIENLKKYLKKDGMMLITFPLFFREDLSKYIALKKMPFTKEYFMKRVSFMNEWIEVNREKALEGDGYDTHFANANVLYIGLYSKGNQANFSSKIKAAEPKSSSVCLLQKIKSIPHLYKSFFEDLY